MEPAERIGRQAKVGKRVGGGEVEPARGQQSRQKEVCSAGQLWAAGRKAPCAQQAEGTGVRGHPAKEACRDGAWTLV